MKETLGEFAYVDGEVFVGSTKAGTMVFDPEQPAWVFTLAVDGAEPVSYDDDLEWALDELRDDLNIQDFLENAVKGGFIEDYDIEESDEDDD